MVSSNLVSNLVFPSEVSFNFDELCQQAMNANDRGEDMKDFVKGKDVRSGVFDTRVEASRVHEVGAGGVGGFMRVVYKGMVAGVFKNEDKYRTEIVFTVWSKEDNRCWEDLRVTVQQLNGRMNQLTDRASTVDMLKEITEGEYRISYSQKTPYRFAY
jgi:hypothetical protein